MRCTMNGVICAGTMPTVTSGVPICAAFSAMTQSATATRPTPPPMHAPSTSAISALGNVSAISRNAPKRRLEAAVDLTGTTLRGFGFLHALEVAAGAEVAARAHQHQNAHAVVVARLREGLAQLAPASAATARCAHRAG